jgi:hypothetical protein
MTLRRLPSPGEMVLLFLVMVGAVWVVAMAIAGAATVAQYVLAESTWTAIANGAPWWLGGLVLGFILGTAYMEGKIDAA